MNIIWILILTSSKLACIKNKVKHSFSFRTFIYLNQIESIKAHNWNDGKMQKHIWPALTLWLEFAEIELCNFEGFQKLKQGFHTKNWHSSHNNRPDKSNEIGNSPSEAPHHHSNTLDQLSSSSSVKMLESSALCL